MATIRPHEPLKLYITTSTNTIECMMAQDDEEEHERVIYYLSRVLTDIESRYSSIENMYLPLFYACIKLKYYMVARTIKVVAQTDLIKYILSSPMLRGQLDKWMLALTEFDLQYIPAKDVKEQVTADAVSDCWKLYFNGSKHKDDSGVGILIISPKHLSKEFKCNNEKLQNYSSIAWELLVSFQKVSLVYIPRIRNEITNYLAQIASKYRILPEILEILGKVRQILVPIEERKVLTIDDWRKSIAEYLKDLSVRVDQKVKIKVNFVMMGDELYKNGYFEAYAMLIKLEKDIALGEVHRGICDAHQARERMKWVLRRDQTLDLIIHHPLSKNHEFILEAIDYFTKWVEGIPLVEAGQNEIIDFIEEYIIYQFGIPQTLSTDQVLPLEINLNTLRIMKQDESPIEDYWNVIFDELNELDNERILALVHLIHQKESIARTYNR
ncbi:uncharacterized protein LOC130939999 [Arachis stenosperma]|uniref:uncharacterized protein LOC130939999 n=1 Tax=Arachis stenosperma TaxID=217475 RepID=UPI0025ACC2F8|nr:uncharacterized protein LOC130939999 [Arachis stenosperma]